MTLFVTGGAGFIGSHFILDWLKQTDEPIINLDKLTYAGNLDNLNSLKSDHRHHFVQGDICNGDLISQLLNEYQPRAILHFAAESHVDRSIEGPADFIQTNIVGTFRLLESARTYWTSLSPEDKSQFRFLHISTDEVYGSLEPDAPAFTEKHCYQPNSPYSASKAASDHLVRAYYHTYHLPVITTNCSNNYGPYQFPEKLIPRAILNALAGQGIPIFGDGQQIRDWLYVGDHCAALRCVLAKGLPGETYNIGGLNEKTNLELVYVLCDHLDSVVPSATGASYRSQITFIQDRAGHDRRYAIDAAKIKEQLNWIGQTIDWYLDNASWIENLHHKKNASANA